MAPSTIATVRRRRPVVRPPWWVRVRHAAPRTVSPTGTLLHPLVVWQPVLFRSGVHAGEYPARHQLPTPLLEPAAMSRPRHRACEDARLRAERRSMYVHRHVLHAKGMRQRRRLPIPPPNAARRPANGPDDGRPPAVTEKRERGPTRTPRSPNLRLGATRPIACRLDGLLSTAHAASAMSSAVNQSTIEAIAPLPRTALRVHIAGHTRNSVARSSAKRSRSGWAKWRRRATRAVMAPVRGAKRNTSTKMAVATSTMLAPDEMPR